MFLLHDHHALGTRWWVEIFDEKDEAFLGDVKKEVLSCITEFEEAYSRFKSTSLLTQLNRKRSLPRPPADMLAMLSLSILLYNRTGGVFDPRVGGILGVTGYGNSQLKSLASWPVDRLEKQKKLSLSDVVTATTQKIELHDDAIIDLAGVGKGYMIGKIKSLLLKKGLQYFFINGGGDIYATSNYDKAVTVDLQHPFQLDTIFAQVALLNQCVCVSSPALRSRKDEKSGKTFSHIVHPLVSEADVSGSVVVGTEPGLCDGLATAFCLLSNEDCLRLAKELGVGFRKVMSGT